MAPYIFWPLCIYLAGGLLFCLVGPAAQSIRQEALSATTQGGEGWRVLVLRLILMAATVLFWPLTVPSAAKSARLHREIAAIQLAQDGPSPDALEKAREIRTTPGRRLTIDEFHALKDGFRSWADSRAVIDAAHEAGYTVQGAVTEEGWAPVSLPVAMNISLPIKIAVSDNGETYFVTMPDTWERMAGRSGRVTIRDGVIVALQTRMIT